MQAFIRDFCRYFSRRENTADAELIEWSNIAFAEIERIHHKFSFHDPLSELSCINHALLKQPNIFHNISKELTELIQFSINLSRQTNGLYDLTVAKDLVIGNQLPNHLSLDHEAKYGRSDSLEIKGLTLKTALPTCIDLGGIAKGFAVDRALSLLPCDLNITINAGGDLMMNVWENKYVEIKYGRGNSTAKKFKMKNKALATTGNYFDGRMSAIVHPFNNKLLSFGGSISVFSSSTMIADALTKAILLVPKCEIKPLLTCFEAQAIRINRFGFSKAL